MLRATLSALALSMLGAQASAQRASVYVPIEDRVMPYVEHLIRSGVIRDPDPLTRPLTRNAIREAVARADTTNASASVKAMVRRVTQEVTPRVSGSLVGLHLDTGPSAGTYARRDPLREAGSSFVSWPTGVHLWTTLGPVLLSSHPYFDRRLRFDPDYPGLKDRHISFRFTDSYVGLQQRYGEFTYGSLARNWGPTGIDGLLVSPAPYSYDHLYVKLGVPALRIESQLAQLDDGVNQVGVSEHRWWITHRIVFRTWPWMRAVIGQATLWKGGGPLEQTWFLNPTRLAFMAREDDNLADSANTLISGDVWMQLPHGIVIQAEGLVDDLNVFDVATAPNRLAGTVIVDVPVAGSGSIRGLWTFVSSLMYRAFDGPIMSIARHNVGLGRNFSDYTQWTFSGSFAPRPGVVLNPDVTLLLQGEGDIRKPMPPWPAPDYPFLLVGTTERTVRFGLGVRAMAFGAIDLTANAGVHFIGNRGNVAGASATRFVGTIGLSYRFAREFTAP